MTIEVPKAFGIRKLTMVRATIDRFAKFSPGRIDQALIFRPGIYNHFVAASKSQLSPGQI